MHNTMYMYRESLQLGHTALSETQFKNVLKQLQEEFQGATYDLLTRNCCHFCEALCDRLRCDPIPGALQLLIANCEPALVRMYEGLWQEGIGCRLIVNLLRCCARCCTVR
jgi:hypothetical protein